MYVIFVIFAISSLVELKYTKTANKLKELKWEGIISGNLL